jgi:hypothetical protein
MDFTIPFLGISGCIARNDRDRNDLVDAYFTAHAGHKGIKAARSQYDAWLTIVENPAPETPGRMAWIIRTLLRFPLSNQTS